MNKKMILMLMLILCMSITFVGCDKRIEVEFPNTPEGCDEEFWKESYTAYVVMKDAIDKDRDFTKDEEKYLKWYNKLSMNKLLDKVKNIDTNSNLNSYEKIVVDQGDLYKDITQLYIDVLELRYYKAEKDKDNIDKCDIKIINNLNKLDEFYESLNK